MKKLALIAALGTLLSIPMLSHAESNVATAASGALSASAKVDFRVKIPKVLFLRVGTGANTLANNTTVDLIDFDVPAANVGDGSSIAATAASGDLTNGAVTVRVFANGGNSATLNSTTTGQLNNGAGDTIPWTEIVASATPLAVATPGYTNAAIVHPAFNNGGSGGAGTATPLTGAGKVIRAESKWTFAYATTAPVPAGTYGGVNVQNGRVTYTASQP